MKKIDHHYKIDTNAIQGICALGYYLKWRFTKDKKYEEKF